ncbi:MAG: hypothetical protein J6Y16_11325 [Treponema sp.]|nr:hypothetical protein [Treponema sp.]
MEKKLVVLLTMAVLCSLCFARSVRKEMPASWQRCTIDGFSYSSPFALKTAGEIFDESNLITREDVKNGGTYGVLCDFAIMPDESAAIFAYEVWVVGNKPGKVGQINKIADVYITVGFLPEYDSAFIYELEVLQMSTGLTTTYTYDGYIRDSEMMAYGTEPFLKMMIKVD